jgi:hypothetical protein
MDRLKKNARDNARTLDFNLDRIMNHFKVIERLVEESPQIRVYIQGEYSVASVPLLLSVARPEADGQTTLESILGRMVSGRNSQDWEFIEANLSRIDRLIEPGLEARIREKYEDDNFQPCIHAEVQVLEFFYREGLKFAEDYTFVACSKPACFCCKLYFRYHPAEPFEWSPPLLLKGNKDDLFEEQRKLVTSVITGLKAEALKRIKGLVKPLPFHFDSVTAITELRSDEGEFCSSSDEDDSDGSSSETFDRGKNEIPTARYKGTTETNAPYRQILSLHADA